MRGALLALALVMSGCLATTGIVYDHYGPVYVQELPGPSPYHRTLRLHNGRPYGVIVAVACDFGGPSDTYYVSPESRRDVVVHVPGPRWTRGFMGTCDMLWWTAAKRGGLHVYD